ncbi:adhesin [Serratia rubidaea]|nr:adhesin [Serratia rubidaea]UJD83171.1 adhesin [Serratia rubidaea]
MIKQGQDMSNERNGGDQPGNELGWYAYPGDSQNAERELGKRLDKKFKHAAEFGIDDTQKNHAALIKFRDAVTAHLTDRDTIKWGTYLPIKDSTVFFNTKTKNVVVPSGDNHFVSGWRLQEGTQQYKKCIEQGILG